MLGKIGTIVLLLMVCPDATTINELFLHKVTSHQPDDAADWHLPDEPDDSDDWHKWVLPDEPDDSADWRKWVQPYEPDDSADWHKWVLPSDYVSPHAKKRVTQPPTQPPTNLNDVVYNRIAGNMNIMLRKVHLLQIELNEIQVQIEAEGVEANENLKHELYWNSKFVAARQTHYQLNQQLWAVYNELMRFHADRNIHDITITESKITAANAKFKKELEDLKDREQMDPTRFDDLIAENEMLKEKLTEQNSSEPVALSEHRLKQDVQFENAKIVFKLNSHLKEWERMVKENARLEEENRKIELEIKTHVNSNIVPATQNQFFKEPTQCEPRLQAAIEQLARQKQENKDFQIALSLFASDETPAE